MNEDDFLAPIDQLYYLNKALIDNSSKINEPIVTVGGQAVHYWVIHYLEHFSSNPESVYITSNDVDFSTKASNLSAISTIFNVDVKKDDSGPPPSIALILLKDKITHKIKSENGKYYVNHELYNGMHDIEPNIVDIIDFPAGFEYSDFKGKKLLSNTEPFQLPIDLETESNELIRVLNPIACVKSRVANIEQKIKKDITVEVERIKSLRIPIIMFIYDKFKNLDFREAKKFLYSLFDLLQNTYATRVIAKYNIDFHIVLDELYNLLKKLHGIEPDFINKDYPHRANYVKKKIERKLSAERNELL